MPPQLPTKAALRILAFRILSSLFSFSLPQFRFLPEFPGAGPLTIHLDYRHLLLTPTASAHHTLVGALTEKGEGASREPAGVGQMSLEQRQARKKKKGTSLPLPFFFFLL